MRSIWLLACLLATPLFAAEYHVAPAGRDDADGSDARPFHTIGRASQQLQPGDSCILHSGTYREVLRAARSGTTDQPIRYLCAPGEKVIISGADPVAGVWQTAGRIARIALPGPVEQLFCQGMMMPEARWPNCTPGQIMDYPRAEAGDGTGYETLADPKLPPGDATGGIVLIWNGSGWWGSTRRIAQYTPGQSLRFDKTYKPTKPDEYHTDDPYQPKSGNPYIIYGALSLLDAPGEWFSDGATLHYMPTGSLEDVEVRRRELGVDLSGLSHIQVGGISFFAAAPSLKDSQNCTISDCRFRYLEHFRTLSGPATSGQVVSGRDNEFRHCSLARTAGSALRILGNNNRVIDCIIFDTDYIGAVDGAISAGDSIGATLSRCTILRTGRDGIQHSNSRRITISYCDISNVDLLNSDASGIYSWRTDGTGSVISYNHVHDNTGDKNVGIYLDNFCKGFTVHHNLSWNNTGAGITLNSDAENHLVVNNTLVNNGKPFATFAYSGHTLTQKGTRIINNLVTGTLNTKDPGCFAQGDLAPAFSHNGKGAIDDHAMPLPGSAAIDAGVEVPGITDGFKGAAPDLGAYESGAAIWSAGATWSVPDMPKALRTSVAWAPLPKVTEKTMVIEGLALWLDAADRASLNFDNTQHLTRWTDKSRKDSAAIPADPAHPPMVITSGIAGRPSIGNGALHISHPVSGLSPVTLLMVAQAPQMPGQWQRLASTWTGKDKDWIAPNWQLAIPSAEKPTPFPAQVFIYRAKEPRTLENLTLGGTAMGNFHIFTGQIAEVLLYTRTLGDDEEEAITAYLTEKWHLPAP